MLSPACIPSLNTLVFISLRPAPPLESFNIALFKSDIRPEEEVSQNISNKLSVGSVS